MHEPYGFPATLPPPPPAMVDCYVCARIETARAAEGQPSVCSGCRALIRDARKRDARR